MTKRFRVWNGADLHDPPHPYIIDGKGNVSLLTLHKQEDRPMSVALFYTGRNDSEGTPIYEGDMLRCEGLRYPVVVYFEQQDASFWVKGPKYHRELARHRHTGGEVIGNRYEDPDLLDT